MVARVCSGQSRSWVMRSGFSIFALIAGASSAFAADMLRDAVLPDTPQATQATDAFYRTFIQGISGNTIDINTDYNKKMFDRQNFVTTKMTDQLAARASGELQDGKLYLGARFSGSLVGEYTNQAGRFPILSQLPPNHPNKTFDRKTVLNDLSFNATLTLPWVTGFVQGEYTEVFYPGQQPWQARKWHFIVGDLKQFPVYAFVGKGTVDFGDMRSYSPFTHSVNTHYFWAQSDDPMVGLGYMQDGWRASATLLHNGRGLRVIDSPRDGAYDNFALNVEKTHQIDEKTSVKAGLGYLNSTIYNHVIAHHPPANGGKGSARNGAIDANLAFTYDKFDVALEHTRTLQKWPATDYPVSATTLQGRYRTSIYSMPTRFYAQAGLGKQGASGTNWERMSVLLAGAEVDLTRNISLGAEIMHHEGFVPLITPKILGRRDVKANTFLSGAKVTF